MEEAKVIGAAELLGAESLEGVFWQWQSGPNPDPWAEKDPAKRTWQDYSDDDCHIIEQAFLLKKEIADLKDYEVDLKKMVQVNKKFRNRVRRVRRQEKSRFMMEMSEPVAIVKNEKTINEAFGTIQHFLEYIMKRTPEAYGLYQRLKTLALDSKTNEFEDIIKGVISCIDKGAEVREKIIKTRSGSQTKSFIDEAKKIINFIEGNSATLGSFLKAILKVYTMETFICYWLNELLRSENWEEINVLTPYLVCLVYTFKLSDYVLKYQEPKGFMNSLLGFVVKPKLYLFRGAALAKEHLELYDPKKIKYFSWNGVTSTSRDKNVALKFIRTSLRKALQLNEAKIGVFFLIETDFASSGDCEGMIDIYENSCSQYPDEKEVILAPGTVFKLLNRRLLEKDIYEVNLKVKKKFEKTRENIALLGTLQDQAIMKDKAIIDGLPSQQSFRLLEMLKGNKLIRKLEIRNSGIEEHIMEGIESLRLTTNVKKEDVKLRDNTIVVSRLGLLAHYYTAEKLNEIFTYNKIRFKDKGDLKSQDDVVEIKALVLDEEALERLDRNNQLKGLSKKIKDASGIERLDLSVRKVEHADNGLIGFLQDIKEFEHLQDLQIKVNENQSLSKDGLEKVCQAIGGSRTLKGFSLGITLSNEALSSLENTLESISFVQNLSLDLKVARSVSNKELNLLKNGLIKLASLQHLSLDFGRSEKISDGGLVDIKDCLRSLISLQHLSLNFTACSKISDEGLNGLIPLISLHHLSLNFWMCNKISDKGLIEIESGLKPLTSLHHLFLRFTGCDNISDEGLSHLNSGLISLVSLQHLALDFWRCNNISDAGLNHLGGALGGLASLQHLSIDFREIYNVSDEGLNHLMSGLMSLASLKHLTLFFKWCNKISDEGLRHLGRALMSLTSLQHLSLNFEDCSKVSDDGLNHLENGLIPLISLKHLTIHFDKCKKISDAGLNHLKSGIISLTPLQHLSMSFKECNKISDEGLNHIKNGFSSLVSLQHLSLGFGKCDQISNQGLNHLQSGLISLSSLQYLSIDLDQCKKFSDEGVNHIKNALRALTSLQHLSLGFRECTSISDDGLNHLRDGLVAITSLQYLSLNFAGCNRISDEGLNHIKSALISLSHLQHLSLEFAKCDKISDKGLSHLKGGLLSFTYLQHLTLSFRECNNISEDGLNNLKSVFVLFTSLQHLSLLLHSCKKISDKARNLLRNELKFIPNLIC